MKGLIFVETLWGVGHFRRMELIAKELAKFSHVDFFVGGSPFLPVENNIENTTIYKIPPLPRKVGDDQELFLRYITTRLKRVFKEYSPPYDYVIFEMFPFGKRLWIYEIETIIEKLKKINPNLLVLSSFRGYISKMQYLESRSNEVKEIESYLLKFFDCAFVHTDPTLLPLETTLTFSNQVSSLLYYTGFVTQDIVPVQNRKKKIIFSVGGGKQGKNLLLKGMKIAPFFPDFEVEVFQGPEGLEKDFNELTSLAKLYKNVQVMKYEKNFPEELASATCSISLGGYNTLLELYQTKTPALIFPGASDQPVLAEKFAKEKWITFLKEEDLEENRLAQLIKEAISNTNSWSEEKPLLIQGQQKVADWIRGHVR